MKILILEKRPWRTSSLHKPYPDGNRPFYSYVWNRGWSWPCFDTNLPSLSCTSSYSYANQYFSRTISITKQRRFVSKQGHRQPHIHSKARVVSPQLKNGLFEYFMVFFAVAYRAFSLTWPASMHIYCNKRKRLHKKRIQLPQDWFGTPTWPPFHCLGTPIGGFIVTSLFPFLPPD